MTDFVNALVRTELFLLGVAPAPAMEPASAAGPAATRAGSATTTISFSQSDYRSAAG